ncbi:MAG: orotate phosphoribosyltransferase [Magnetovibrionaceae bacterium]
MTSPATSSPAASPFGRETARILLDIKAVNFRPKEPYTLTAGWASPVYIDCRKLISFVPERRRVIEMATELLKSAVDLEQVGALAGGETAGIPYAAWLSESTGIPMVYVRKKPKGFGRMAQIEGDLPPGKTAILVEDLATDGGSKLTFVNVLREADTTVTDSFVVFFYGAFANALDSLKEHDLNLHYLATWHDVLAEAEAGQDFDAETLDGVRDFLADPIAWSARHGGRDKA